MTKIPPDDVLESLYKLRVRESDQLKTVLEFYDMEIHQKIPKPNYQQLKTMVTRSINQKLRLRNFDARNERIETVQWLRTAGVNVVLREDKENAVNGKQKDSVREETSVVSGTMKITVRNRHQKPLHPLNLQHKEVEVRRGKITSKAGVHLESSLDCHAKTT